MDRLESVVRVARDAGRAAVKALRYVLQRKDEVSYIATVGRPNESEQVLERLQQFGDRAERPHDQRR